MNRFKAIDQNTSELPQVPEAIMPAVLLQEQGKSVELSHLSETLISEEDFDNLRRRVLEKQAALQKENAYHNYEHTADVDRRFFMLAQMIGLSPQEIQLGRLAALFHDDGHCGDTIRQDSVRGSYISNEEYAAYMATQELTQASGLSEADITFVQSAILATTFGQDHPEHPYRRNYRAHNIVEHLLKFADIASFLDGAKATLADSRKLQSEGVKSVVTEQETIEDAQKFLSGYVEPLITSLEDVVSRSYGDDRCAGFIAEIRQNFESVSDELRIMRSPEK